FPWIGGLFVAFVELDVASTRMAAAQIASGEVAVGQLDLKYVVAARLALVAHPHSRRACLTVYGDVVIDDPAIRIIRVKRVAGHGRLFDVHAVAVVDVIQVAPERAVLDATRHTEVGFRARGCAGNPSTARHEVAHRRPCGFSSSRAGARNPDGRGAEHQVHAGEHINDVQGIDCDHAETGALLIDDHVTAVGQEHELVGRSGHSDGLAVDDQTGDPDNTPADSGHARNAGCPGMRHHEVSHDCRAAAEEAGDHEIDVG